MVKKIKLLGGIRGNRVVISILITLVTFNLPSYSQGIELGSWNILNIKYSHNKKLSFFGEGQIRSLQFYNSFHYYEYKAGINYQLDKGLALTLAGGSYQTYKEGGNFVKPKNNDEFRLWPQVLLSQQIWKLKIEQRYRLEMRWTSAGYRNRFRYRLGVAYPFGKENKGYKPFQIAINNELFFTDKEPYFERNRSQIAFNYKLSKQNSIQLGYLHQFDYKINDETGRDFLVVGVYFDLQGKKASQ